MRRPPDKDGHPALSERDVETSNATLNTLFGGAKQKSWMIGAGSPVRPTPRTSISRPSGSQLTLSQRKAATIIPSPAPSDEPSPTLPQSPQELPATNGKNNPPFVTAGPSSNISVQDASYQSPTQATQTHCLSPMKRSLAQSVGPTHLPRLEEPYRNIAENPPLPSSVFLPSESPHSLPEATVSSSTDRQQHPNQTLNSSADFPGHPWEAAFPSPIGSLVLDLSPAQSVQRSRQASREGLSSPHQSQPYSPTVLAASNRLEEASPQPQGSSLSNPHKRQKMQQGLPSLQLAADLISTYLSPRGANARLNNGLERTRFQLLQKACRLEDMFYVALHQIFCLWDCNQDEIAKIPGFPNKLVLQAAFMYLSQLIRENEHIAPSHKTWLANFPNSLSELMRTSVLYVDVVSKVGEFLTNLASDWGQITVECRARKYPPLVFELINRLKVLSPTLQLIMITATRRNIVITEGAFATRMDEIARKDQQDYQTLCERYKTSRPLIPQDFYDHRLTVINLYLNTYKDFMEQRQVTGTVQANSTTPVVPSSSLVLPMPYPSEQQNLPDPASNWQHFIPRQSTIPSQQLITGHGDQNRLPNTSQHNTPPNLEPFIPNSLILQGQIMNPLTQQHSQLMNHHNQMETQPQRHQINNTYPIGNFTGMFPQVTPQMVDQAAATMHQQQPWTHYQTPPIAPQQHQQRLVSTLSQSQTDVHQQRQPQQRSTQQQVFDRGHASQVQVTTRRDSNEGSIRNRSSIQSRSNSVGSRGGQVPDMTAIHERGRTPQQLADPRNEPLLALDQTMRMNLEKYNKMHPLQRPLVPPTGYSQPSQQTNPELTALHQAHLRSPRLVAADSVPSNTMKPAPNRRYYQAVKGFALAPAAIYGSVSFSTFEFAIPAVVYARICQDSKRAPGQLATREFQDGSLQYRLRCAQFKGPENKCSVVEWVTHDTLWPESASVDINGNHLDIRRKHHHGKDLPIDITPWVHAAGPGSKNRISISITRGREKLKDNYYIAVEVVEILAQETILDLVQTNHIPANQTLESIKKSLAPTDGDDDDFAMVVSDLAIDLADPFTARIFEIPVRGSSCLHRECFDLKTFLTTRVSKPKRPDQPCMVDVWKCPLCSKDARPYSLRVDDFLAFVRQSLEVQGLLDVKAIWIRPDGIWRPKLDERTGVADPNDSDDASDGEMMPSRKEQIRREENQPANKNKKIVEVISLDDD